MAAPKKNSYWRLRLAHGRKHKIKTPTQLLNAAIEYLEHLDESPLYAQHVVAYKGDSYDHPVEKMRAPTLQGFWVHVGIGKSTWYDMKDPTSGRKGFPEVCEWIESAFYDWKFQGAAAGLLNHAIIARDLGLKEHTDITSADQPIHEVVVSYD